MEATGQPTTNGQQQKPTTPPPLALVNQPVQATQSESIAKLALALAKAQGTFAAAVKDRDNPYFGSSYATLSSVWEACRKGLADNELAVVQQVSRLREQEVSVRTVLLHSSGEWMASVIALPVRPLQKKDGKELPITAQSYGSAITYGRRYGLAAIVGIAPDDDDGNTASHQPRSPPGRPDVELDPEEAHRPAQAAAKARESKKAEQKPALKTDAPAAAGFAKPNLDRPIIIFGKDKKGKFIAELTGEQLEAAIKAGQGWLEKNAQHDSRTDMQLNVQQLEVELQKRMAAAEGEQAGEVQ